MTGDLAAPACAAAFAPALIDWQLRHGRHGLPWQCSDPYRVWLSEIMLQQTQVATVQKYYERFVAAFPDVRSLAAATLDDVLGLWSGLGYYSRARHLHRCAQEVCARFGGRFPLTQAELQQLPGIGASTAAAIAAFAGGERVSILDANVQRVLTRVLAFGGDLATAAARRELAARAHALLPLPGTHAQMTAYTQGLMDLGAMVCKPRQPACAACPVQSCCAARAAGTQQHYPVRTRRLLRSAQQWWMLAAYSAHGVWLEKRADAGIWAGLHALPLFASEPELRAALAGVPDTGWIFEPAFRHVLTHRDLYLHPVAVSLDAQQAAAFAAGRAGRWVQDWSALGLPTPMRRWLDRDRAEAPGDTAAPAAQRTLFTADPSRGGA